MQQTVSLLSSIGHASGCRTLILPYWPSLLGWDHQLRHLPNPGRGEVSDTSETIQMLSLRNLNFEQNDKWLRVSIPPSKIADSIHKFCCLEHPFCSYPHVTVPAHPNSSSSTSLSILRVTPQPLSTCLLCLLEFVSLAWRLRILTDIQCKFIYICLLFIYMLLLYL